MSGKRKGISDKTLEVRKAIVADSQQPIELVEILNNHKFDISYPSFYQQFALMKYEGVMEGVGLKIKGRKRSVIVKARIKEYGQEHYVRQKDPAKAKKEEIKREGNITKVTAGSYHTGQGKKASPPVYIGSTMGML